jgi:Fe-S-cluster-containing hydrogenase component 2
MQKTFTITPTRCTACRTCELACSFKHSGPGGMGVSRIRSFLFGDGKNQILTCFQCDDAACVRVCPVTALVRNDSTGAVDVDEDRCIGCGLCSIACPFGHMAHAESGLAVKCDLCKGQPACAFFCPTQTLEYK